MTRRYGTPTDTAEDEDPPRNPYDTDDTVEQDLWFMPADPDAQSSPADPPWPMARRDRAPRSDGWRAAEAGNAAALARAAGTFGALDERLRHGPAGWRRRLICMEVSDLSWHLGDRVAVDRLALYLVLRLTALGDDGQAMARAAWAVRRLDRDGPLDLENLTGFLGREPVALNVEPDFMARPLGTEFDALSAEWRAELEAFPTLHPITRAALAWAGWRRAGLSGEEAQVEGAVIAERIGSDGLRPGGIGFLPLALGGSAALRASGGPEVLLPAWYEGVERAALRGLMECDRLDLWQRRAEAATSDLSGRTPRLLLLALAQWPLVSAPMLEHETGASRAAVQRNMLKFQELGLVREVTGQSRFRFWQVSIA